MLKESALPNRWVKKQPWAFPPYQKPAHTAQIGGLLTSFATEKEDRNLSAAQELQLYDRTHWAIHRYGIRRIGYASTRNRKWRPLDLSHANLSADAYKARCSQYVRDDGRIENVKACEIKARYGKFVSILEADVLPPEMPLEAYIQVLQAIDRQLLQCVDSFADKRWEEE